MSTPSADIMSSPDPLIDSPIVHSFMPSSVRSGRVTRSVRSSRFVSAEKSPRKQMFELEVGDGKAPQKLLVTVETEGGSAVKSARRKLFSAASPSSVRRRGAIAPMTTTTTTTTTVPLRDSIEDEATNTTATPRRRGRPRKSNGTPMPGAGTKRKASTPVRRTPRQPRPTRSDDAEEFPPIDAPAQPTPTPKKRGRPPRNAAVEPSSELGAELTQTGLAMKSARRRRQAFIPDEMADLVDQVAEHASIQDDPNQMLPNDDDVDLIMAPDEVDMIHVPDEVPGDDDFAAEPAMASSASVEQNAGNGDAGADDDSDIWMATLSDDATPRAPTREIRDFSRPAIVPDVRSPTPQDDQAGGDSNDYGYLAAAASDVSSVDDVVPRTNDTIAQGEDFSMIFMDSIPSLQASLRASFHADTVPAAEEEEIGEETNLIINNTLESLRESIRQEFAQEAEEEDAEAARDLRQSVRQTNSQEESEAEDATGREIRLDGVTRKTPTPPAPTTDNIIAEAPDKEPTPSRSDGRLSPGQSRFMRQSRSPRKPRDSPFRRQALTFTARQAEDQGFSRFRETEQPKDDTRDTLSRPFAGRTLEEQSNLYEDSFSEIPQEILAAATPRRPANRRTSPTLEAVSTAPDEISGDEAVDEVAIEEPVEEFADEVDGGYRPEAMVGGAEAQEQEQKQEQAESLIDEFEAEAQVEDLMEEDDVEFEEQAENMVEEAIEDHTENMIDGNEPAVEEPAADMIDEVELDEQVEDMVDEGGEPPAPSHASMVSRSDNTRLPTPDDTPPYNEGEQQEAEKSTQVPGPSSGAADPVVDDEANELPSADVPSANQLPRLSVAAAVPRVVTKMTPLNQMSSPVQEPQSVGVEGLNDRLLRPALSPIVRAGRALQSVTSDPPSPDRVERQLGSPFRSSVSKESWSGSKESQNSRRLSASSPRQASLPREQPAVTGEPNEDPFAASSKNNGQTGFMQALTRSMASSTSKDTRPFRASGGSSMRMSHHGDDMSWIADEGPLSPRLRGDNTLKDTVPQSLKASTTASNRFALGQIDGAADDVAEPAHSEEEESVNDDGSQPAADDETDIWEFEAQRDTSASTRQQPFGNKVVPSVQRRRGLPSPWKRNGLKPASQERKEGADSPSKQTVPVNRHELPEGGPDDNAEYSMLAERQRAKDLAAAPPSTGKSKPFDLLAFFSSPAALPGMLAKQFLPSKAAGPAGAAVEQPEAEQPPPIMPTTSMFPQPPQRMQPRTGGRNAASPLSRSKPTAGQARDEPMDETMGEAVDEQSSPSTPEQTRLPTVAQKKNFTPNPKQPSESFFRSSANQSAATTPPRMQLSHADIQRWQQETSNASEESPGFRRPLLRPLPPKNASPTKSSLRSPLKPHTPGRVVEFTSSVLSPVEQARARHQRRLSNSTAASQPTSSVQAPAVEESPDLGDEHDHQEPDVTMSEPSPVQRPSRPSQQQQQQQQNTGRKQPQSQEPLSRTVWTRQHWVLLDSLLQLRRQGPFGVAFVRRADRFLGKSVKSHGEAMRLERWHLDCVDAFKAEVGGWDEALLVKRVFALLLGEERRRRSAGSAKRRTVMFH